ncbi:MAG: hypothetical protein WC924_02685 [Candidatus Gracilibacteria bacterium]
MFDKIFIPFYVISGLFVIMLLYLGTVYFYNPDGELSEEAYVEINLPVIQLDDYLNLSKSIK